MTTLITHVSAAWQAALMLVDWIRGVPAEWNEQ